MHAIRITELGGPDVLTMREIPVPAPAPGEVLVRLAASGVNYVDVYYRTGHYPQSLPFTPGVEGAGVVESLGDGVTGVAPGDRVAYALQQGSYAEYATVPAWKLVPIPDAVDYRSAAAAMVQGMTAHYLAHSTYAIQPGDTVLIHAAAGGVGILLTQMAHRLGAGVIATTSTEAKAALARRAGADEVILYDTTDFVTAVQRLTDGAGVAAVYDGVGRSTFEGSLECLARRGVLALFGTSSGPVPAFDPARLSRGSLFLTRPALADYVADRDSLLARASDVLGWIADGTLDVRVSHVYPLAAAAQAQRDLEARRTTGKIVLEP